MWRKVHFGGVLRGPQVVGEGRTPEDALPRMLRILRSPSAGAPHPQESHERRTPEDALLRMGLPEGEQEHGSRLLGMEHPQQRLLRMGAPEDGTPGDGASPGGFLGMEHP